jgi:hypothetical protein
MCAAVREMADNQIILISDADRELILGLALQLEMRERIPASYAPRVEKIYATYQQNQYL